MLVRKEAIVKRLWSEIQDKGLPLIATVSPNFPKLFIDEYWDMDKLNTPVVCTIDKEPIARMPLAKAILNMLIFTELKRFDILKGQYDNYEDYIFTESGNIKSQDSYIDMVKDDCFNRMGMKFFEVTEVVGKLREAFVQFAWVIDSKKMMDISMLDIFELCDADDTLRDWILNGPIKRDDMSLWEVEELKKHTLDYIEKVVAEKNIQPLRSLLEAGTGVRLAQFIDCLFMIGTRPDQDEVIPNIEPESWLRGIQSEKSFYYESYISRCATIITKLDIRDPGAFQKYISYLNNSNYLHKNPEYMCDSIHYREYEIKDQHDLDMLNDRYMITNDNPKDVTVITKDMTHLIGKKIKLRSPSTCNSKEGICRYCAGEHIYFDNVYGPMGANANLGVKFTKEYIGEKGQNFLSSKHNMITIIRNIKFYHDKFIVIDVKYVDIIQVNGKIIIDEKYRVDDPVKDMTRTLYSGFKVETDGGIYEVTSDGLLELREDGNLHVIYKNMRKSKSYIDIKAILKRPFDYKDPITELNKVLESPYIVGETVCRNLICKHVDDGTKDGYDEKMDFSKPLKPNESLKFMSYINGIKKAPGLVNKLCFGYFNEILVDPDNYVEAPPMNYDALYADRSNHEAYVEEYKEKYKEELEKEMEEILEFRKNNK